MHSSDDRRSQSADVLQFPRRVTATVESAESITPIAGPPIATLLPPELALRVIAAVRRDGEAPPRTGRALDDKILQLIERGLSADAERRAHQRGLGRTVRCPDRWAREREFERGRR